MSYKVKEVSALVGVSVRTLHHYDQIGLLKPGIINQAGYRFYNKNELEKLQQILFFKEIGFSLQEIKAILESPDFDREQALISHKNLLIKKKQRLEEIIKTVDETISSIKGGEKMEEKKMFKAFDMTDIEKHKEKYAEETRQKYGDSDAYKESQKRTSAYTKEDWARITEKGDEIYKKLSVLMGQNKNPSDPQVQELIAAKRQFITDSYYNCTPGIFRGLGEMYIADERFTANIDRFGTGLAKFLSEAIKIYCNNLNE